MTKRNRTLEINFAEPEAFALVVQSTTDGDRITQEAKQTETDKQQSEKLQQQLV